MQRSRADSEDEANAAPISVGVERIYLNHVEKDISALQNRLELLKEQKRLE